MYSSFTFEHLTNDLTHEQCVEIGHVFSLAHTPDEPNKEGPCPHTKMKEIKKISQNAQSNFILVYQNITPEKQKLCAFLHLEKDDSSYYIHDICASLKGVGLGASMVTVAFGEAIKNNIEKILLEPTPTSYAFYENLLFDSYVCPEKEKVMMKNTNIKETYEYLNAVYNKAKL